MRRYCLYFVIVCVAATIWFVIQTQDARRRPSVSKEVTTQASAETGNTSLHESAAGRQTPPTPIATSKTDTNKVLIRRTTLQKDESAEAVIAKDIADGINEEARAKEAKLRGLSEGLKSEFTVDQVLQAMGEPDMVQLIKVEGAVMSLPRTNSAKLVPLRIPMLLSYWPRIGVPFDGRNGQGYHVLYLRLSADHRLERWYWEQPLPLYFGSYNALKQQAEYWEGKHARSEPPP